MGDQPRHTTIRVRSSGHLCRVLPGVQPCLQWLQEALLSAPPIQQGLTTLVEDSLQQTWHGLGRSQAVQGDLVMP
jgi:hypothetical protein